MSDFEDRRTTASEPELEAMRERAAGLAREIMPERDLWHGIENRIAMAEAERAEAAAAPRFAWLRELFPRPALAGAFAAMLVAVTVGTTLWVAGPSGGPLSDADVRAIAERVRMRDGVSEVNTSIRQMLDAQREALPVETLATIEQNLLAIDRAIAEIHVAIEQHPEQPGLEFMLAEAYRSEAELLERLEWWLASPGAPSPSPEETS